MSGACLAGSKPVSTHLPANFFFFLVLSVFVRLHKEVECLTRVTRHKHLLELQIMNMFLEKLHKPVFLQHRRDSRPIKIICYQYDPSTNWWYLSHQLLLLKKMYNSPPLYLIVSFSNFFSPPLLHISVHSTNISRIESTITTTINHKYSSWSDREGSEPTITRNPSDISRADAHNAFFNIKKTKYSKY